MGWVGGKRALTKTIVALLPRHETYVEVFGGAAWVLFAKEPVRCEVYNDLDGRLVELFRSVKYHPDEFCRELEWLLTSREMWAQLRAHPGMTEIQRAARFYYVLQLAFGSKMGSPSFVSGPSSHNRLLPERVRVTVDAVRVRLGATIIEREDYEAILARFDGPGTAFYLDPPYIGSEGKYAVPFGAADHERLCAALGRAAAKWLLTYNDCDWVREAYAPWHQYQVEAPYGISSGPPVPTQQLIITSYPLTRAMRDGAPRKVTKVPRRKAG